MYIITSTKKKKKRKEKKMIYNTTLKDLIYLSVIFATVFDLGTTRKQRLFENYSVGTRLSRNVSSRGYIFRTSLTLI